MIEIDEIRGTKKEIPKNVSGIYFLFSGDELVYVGKSLNAIARVHSHKKENIKRFDSYSVIECEEKELEKLEAEYIKKFKTKYNVCHIVKKSRGMPLSIEKEGLIRPVTKKNKKMFHGEGV